MKEISLTRFFRNFVKKKKNRMETKKMQKNNNQKIKLNQINTISCVRNKEIYDWKSNFHFVGKIDTEK